MLNTMKGDNNFSGCRILPVRTDRLPGDRHGDGKKRGVRRRLLLCARNPAHVHRRLRHRLSVSAQSLALGTLDGRWTGGRCVAERRSLSLLPFALIFMVIISIPQFVTAPFAPEWRPERQVYDGCLPVFPNIEES